MPRKITVLMTLDDIENEILYTRAGISADPDARELLPRTEHWLANLDSVRAVKRKEREATANADAARMVANTRLDMACKKFGDQLFLDVGKKRDAGRWKQFFSTHTTGSFTKQALHSQVAAVAGWMSIADAVFAPHKDTILQWNNAAEAALKTTAATGAVRGESAIAEETHADNLTRERDGLQSALVEKAAQLGLPREWPDTFFRPDRRARSAEGDPADVTEPTTPAT